MKKIIVIILISLFILLVAIFTCVWYLKESSNEQAVTVPIEKIFESKVVYTSNQKIDTKRLKEDCTERDGKFNACGSICPPDTEVCSEVCAYTCEEIGADGGGEDGVLEEWEVYQNSELRFSMRYPEYLNINEGESMVKFSYWGPTQRRGTELYDGISLTIRGLKIGTSSSIVEYVQKDIEEAKILGEIIEGLATTTKRLDDTLVYTYTMRTLGLLHRIVMPNEGEKYDFLEITYSAPDPTNTGHDAVVDKMLDSFSRRPDK